MHLNIAKDISDRSGEGIAYESLGSTYFYLGDLKKAIEHHQRHLSISKEVGDRSGEGRAYSNLGSDYYSLNDFTKAIEYHRLHLSIATQLGDRHGEGNAYANLGIDYASLGNYKRAVQYYKLHLSVVQETGDRVREGCAHSNLGVAYRNLGDYKTAIGYHQKQLRIAKDLADKHEEGQAYASIGNCYRYLGDSKTAIKNYNLDLSVSKEVGSKKGEERAYANLSAAYCYLCDFQKAINHCQLHLNISKEVGNKLGEGKAYSVLGDVYHFLKNYEKAIEYHQLALSVSQDVKDKGKEGHAYQSLGRDYCAKGDFQQGMAYHQLHLSVAKQVGDKPEEGIATYHLGNVYYSLDDFQKAEDCYKLSVRLFNSLRNSLQSNDGWKYSLRNYHQDTYTALCKVQLQQDKINEALLTAEYGRGRASMDLMESQYNLRSTRFGSSEDREDTEALNDILSYISSQTVFVAVGQHAINLWVLNKDTEPTFVQNKIDERYLKENVIASLVSWKGDTHSRTGVLESVGCEDRSLDEMAEEELRDQSSGRKPSAPSYGRTNDPLRILYDVIIGPIEGVISGNEVTIVADGLLFMAPFAAFKDKYSRYLFETFKIRLIPTLTSLKILAECPEKYSGTTDALLVGDPWVESVCIEKKVQKNEKKKRKKKDQRKVENRLSQLPAAKREVEMIGTILDVEPVTGKQATKEEVLRRLPSAELIHVAAHANAETGEIALSPNSTRSSKNLKEADYLLTMKDVENVKMQAKLVVLSCCHSGRGEAKSEGVMGIARAFLGAGARSVLATLWAISDEATHEFMRNFYNNLADGLSASTCLNQAMKVMRESDRFSTVKDWASFVLAGDDVTLDFSRDRSGSEISIV